MRTFLLLNENPAPYAEACAYIHRIYRSRRPHKVTITRYSPRRSNQQNRLYFGPWMALIESHTGMDKDSLHGFFREKFLGREPTYIGEVVRSTAQLTKAEWADYTEQVRAWCAIELGLTLPEPTSIQMEVV